MVASPEQGTHMRIIPPWDSAGAGLTLQLAIFGTLGLLTRVTATRPPPLDAIIQPPYQIGMKLRKLASKYS